MSNHTIAKPNVHAWRSCVEHVPRTPATKKKLNFANKRDFLMEVGDFSFLLREIVLFRAWGSQGRRRSWVRGPFLEVIKAGVLRESALDTVDYGASSIIY
ncbi:uncharacterized protein LOC135170491 isoform X2 [Diachasmimorpha longicaudata]|uniref:uncharacterized protein LOC135170491 isoform X2 n=1 Tax=Diachasmimorpha longicaudata TaxID=58733 RepID=UPI0030B914E8